MGWIDFVGPAGVGLWSGAIIGLLARRKLRKRAATGDEEARHQLTQSRIVDRVVVPGMIVVGTCLLAGQFYLDYQKALTPLSPEKALERAMKNFPVQK